MYEVHPDNKGQWLLYRTGDGGFDLVGTFPERVDAEHVRDLFSEHDRLEQRLEAERAAVREADRLRRAAKL